jgi:hypothetical protein
MQVTLDRRQKLAWALAPHSDRRGAPRHPILQRCLVLDAGAVGDDAWRCIAYDLSLTGIGITLPAPVREGALLTIEPFQLAGAGPLRARVVHCRLVEWAWFCGCQFDTPLTEEMLQTWLSARLTG